MDDKTRIAAGIARHLQGLGYDDKRLAEIAAEVEVLNDAVRKAARHGVGLAGNALDNMGDLAAGEPPIAASPEQGTGSVVSLL